jgi:hypothetical protein
MQKKYLYLSLLVFLLLFYKKVFSNNIIEILTTLIKPLHLN